MVEMIKNRRLILILSIILGIVAVFAVYQYARGNELTYQREIEYNRVFAELTEYVDDLEITLLKGQVVSTPEQMARLSAELYTQASGAKANLALLPIGEKKLEKTSEFLSQVGEYAYSISAKMQRGEKPDEKDLKTMKELGGYAKTLKGGLDAMLRGINDGSILFGNGKNDISPFLKDGKLSMAGELAKLEDEFHNYPSLIYDGPFSQHLNLKESVFVKGKPEITKKQALRRAKNFTGKKEASVSEISGKLPAYSVTAKGVTAEYTKQGGILLLLMKDRSTDNEKISVRKAKKLASEFLKENGFKDMKESYHEKRDGSVVINYAYQQDQYIVYPDLVKVKVALDNGEIIGFESRGYVMNHIYRQIPKIIISKEEALENVNEGLNVSDIKLAVIPLKGGSEAFCYQIKGTVSKKHFLMFVNTQTGHVEDIQILLESEGGVLAV